METTMSDRIRGLEELIEKNAGDRELVADLRAVLHLARFLS